MVVESSLISGPLELAAGSSVAPCYISLSSNPSSLSAPIAGHPGQP